MLDEKLILVGGRWHVARLIDYGHIGMGWGDPEDTSLICVAGDEERVAELPLPSGAEPVAWTNEANLRVMRQNEPLFYACIHRENTAEWNVPLYASPQSSSQVTEEMVEVAARALYAQAPSYEVSGRGYHVTIGAEVPWRSLAKGTKDKHRDNARAALVAALSPVKGDGQ